MKKYLVFVLAALLIGGLVTGALAAPGGKSNVAHLYLYEKNPENWDAYPITGGAWGKLKYNLEGPEFEFVFNGHGLDPRTDYSLIYYPEVQDTWPWPVFVIDSGTSNGGGNIHLGGSYDFGFDLLYVAGDQGSSKIWLVLTEDISGGSLSGWNPTEYLFENNLISYTDTS